MKKHYKLTLAAVAASFVLAACSQGNSAPPSGNGSGNRVLQSSKLQLAVGVANVAGALSLNVVSTLRQGNGDSAVLVDTPTLTGPFALPVPGATPNPAGSDGKLDGFSTNPVGPSAQEVATKSTIMGTPQTVRPGTPACNTATPCAELTGPSPILPNTTTFGQSGGVFAMGFAPFNHTINGTPLTYEPYSEPLYDGAGVGQAGGNDKNAFVPWGGPPAFSPDGSPNGVRDGSFNLGSIQGVAMGITSFDGVTPNAGTYALSVQIPTGLDSNGNSSFGTLTATANLSNTAGLPTVTAPAFAPDGKGGGTFTGVTLSGGASEGYIEITDFGPAGASGATTANCQGALGTSAFPVYYTILVKPAATTYSLPDSIGPNTTQNGPSTNTPSPSICTGAQNSAALGAATPGDTYTVQFIEMDYPLYEATPSIGNAQAPQLAGANGQADISISLPLVAASP